MIKLEGKLLITGGSGSLGTAIVKRAVEEEWDTEITVVSRNETKMQVLKQAFPQIKCEIGDVRDEDRLVSLFRGQDIVIHAAAIKIVPVAEANPREAILTNVMGSLNVCKAAIAAKVPKVVGISSDKACGPTYYGLTKRLMEGLFREASEWGGETKHKAGETKFVACRYGNVLKSSNSIIPLFEKQVAAGQPLTITDTGMTRFWLSMCQAIDLILLTLDTAKSGEIFVPQAPAMALYTLAMALYPGHEVKVIGVRPGERLHETLIVQEESSHTTLMNNQHSSLGMSYFCIHNPKVFNYSPDDPLFDPSFTYTSQLPDHWIQKDELLSLLEES